MNKNLSKLLFPYLFVKEKFFWLKTNKKNLPGKDFYYFGKSISRKLLFKGVVTPKLLFNPVSIVRYFEYDFALKNITKYSLSNKKALDISSPYLFGFYCTLNLNIDYTYLNPDANDFNLVKKYSKKILNKHDFNIESGDATKLSYPDESFDLVISISVIEHIDNDGDIIAIKEMMRVLKKNGILILTFPVSKSFEIEYTDNDTYGLNVSKTNNKFFFQRLYDESSIEERLLNNITDFTILEQQIFGENEYGFYDKYSERWKNFGLLETVKDPFYISRYFNTLNSFDEIKKTAVIGITLRKDK
ncbi:MAG: methyltransferase domain-containing protein [Ignavibacteriaceae bacterium]|nr:methyltransferase domain-containing protein [Ignavibacteriaceae bacterium]